MKFYEINVFTTATEAPIRYFVEAENGNDAEDRAEMLFGNTPDLFAIAVKPVKGGVDDLTNK